MLLISVRTPSMGANEKRAAISPARYLFHFEGIGARK